VIDDKHKKGLRAELLAQAYFIEKGFRVFAAVGGIGPIDFIAVDKDNNVRYFDVKFKSYRKDGTKICRVNKKVKGVKIEIVYVDLFSGEISVAQHDQKEWHKRYKIARDENGKYTGEVLSREEDENEIYLKELSNKL